MHLSYKLLAAFILGSIPFPVLIPYLLYGIDIRKSGSGNPGTTNAYRILSQHTSKIKAIMVTTAIGLLDLSKGIIAGLLFDAPGAASAVMGQIYSPFLGFSGGKGVGIFLGTFAGVTREWIYVTAPITWTILTLYPKILNILPITHDWIDFKFFAIKKTFFASWICMSISMIFLLFGCASLSSKFILSIIFCWIIYQHKTHIRYT